MSASPTVSEPCIALGFFTHSSTSSTSFGGLTAASALGLGPASGSSPRQAALVLRHDRTRRRGVRVDVSVTSTSTHQEDDSELFGISLGRGAPAPATERPPARMIEDLEETARLGGYFGVVGKVWNWISTDTSSKI